ncbi:alpha-1,2-fucosyltransferase [Marinilongibacter aquaticus]|uniref:alpha-1,2-fucosyltransferase n=1 Tax=Marinilongibacter aquaticus TaxID=2975157 RepID=UPI0021BD8CE5|nr:alpha-1,2-fucosyltransferase [Marinilongibacter aquaticus]UBM60728.1 alpha-1,2-fucosyltransferase [Marinilongibacter aquaticus]
MIGVYFMGRLGNQIFQYYYLQYLKQQTGKLCFFPNPHHAYLGKYFDLGPVNNVLLNSKLYSVLARIIPKVFPFKPLYIQNFSKPRERDIANWTMVYGYFQSDYYAKKLTNYEPLKLKKPFSDAFHEKFGAVFGANKTVVVHIRRTDYLNYGKRDISLPISYFQEQLNTLPNIEEYTVFFVSDDMEFVKNAFPAQPNFIFTSNSEIIDFQLIQNADVAIISNSTFAWWACYFSPKKQRVIAPKNWMAFRIGREHPQGVMTDKFEWVEVPKD